MTDIINEPKDATPSVVAQHAAMLNALPFSDTRDFDDETAVLEPRSCGVPDAPVKPGHDSVP
ncbi:hypothetical protein [Bradyrhizobium vignae]|uniref:hypothetical protein n=1 Tax=Bradyrhizobium vignae TaxID=1549949 RepID=UPI00100BFCF2|nr:hypothetical protein [Bradyrhizobium vignae]RXG92730.1 hypothetical protein EAV90_26955 [Bradyrhizobium vignae]